MDASALVRAAGGDPSDEGDIIFHLCEKIREQSLVMNDLQKRVAQYDQEGTGSANQQLAQKCKELERKLADLTKSIPLSDTLSFPPPNVSLSLSQLVELYSLLYIRMNEVLKEKEELQANLHEEILFSDEQSVILETMREEMVNGTHRHSESDQSQEAFGNVAQEDPRAEEQLRAGTEDIAEAYAEIAKLEEEKNALLEYVEQQAMREEQTAGELRTLREELKSLREENEHLQLPQSPVISHNGGSAQQTQQDLVSLRSAYERTMLEMEELEEQNQNLQQAVAKASNLASFREIEVLKAREALETTQKELMALKRKQQETLDLLEELKEFQKAEEEANLAVLREEQVTKLEDDNKSLRRLLSNLQEEIESLHSQNTSVSTSSPTLKPTLDQTTSTDNSPFEAASACTREVEALQLTLSQLISRLSPSSI